MPHAARMSPLRIGKATLHASDLSYSLFPYSAYRIGDLQRRTKRILHQGYSESVGSMGFSGIAKKPRPIAICHKRNTTGDQAKGILHYQRRSRWGFGFRWNALFPVEVSYESSAVKVVLSLCSIDSKIAYIRICFLSCCFRSPRKQRKDITLLYIDNSDWSRRHYFLLRIDWFSFVRTF